LGTCWIGAFDEGQIKEILGISPQIRVVALLPLGYPQDPAPVEKSRLPLEKIVKYERW
jgi:nitroreductase